MFSLFQLIKAGSLTPHTTYRILTTHHTPRPHALLHAPRAPSNKTVPLQGLIILHMLCKLSQRVARGRALSATKERHVVKPREETADRYIIRA